MTTASARSQLKRHPERAVPDEVDAILAQGLVAHVGFVEDGQPFVIPMTYFFDPERPDRLHFHGSPESRIMDVLRSGRPVCIAVSLVDELKASKAAKAHSLNYRSVVVFGRGHVVADVTEKWRVFERQIGAFLPGRTAGVDYSPPGEQDLRDIELVEVLIEEKSGKKRAGPPTSPADLNPLAPGSNGTIPPQRRADWRAYLAAR